MTDEQVDTNTSNEQQPPAESWQEVGRQFQTMGEGLATVFRTAWEKEENRQHIKDMENGLKLLVSFVKTLEENPIQFGRTYGIEKQGGVKNDTK